MGSDHLATTLQAGDAGFEDPAFAFSHQFNAGAGTRVALRGLC